MKTKTNGKIQSHINSSNNSLAVCALYTLHGKWGWVLSKWRSVEIGIQRVIFPFSMFMELFCFPKLLIALYQTMAMRWCVDYRCMFVSSLFTPGEGSSRSPGRRVSCWPFFSWSLLEIVFLVRGKVSNLGLRAGVKSPLWATIICVCNR